MQTNKRSKAEERIARGQCPDCGEEAAPYRLCGKCRLAVRTRNHLKRGKRVGVYDADRDGRGARWGLAPDHQQHSATLEKWSTPIVLPDDDKRGHPKLRGVRIDVEETLVGLLQYLGRPSSLEEILSVWGRLRPKRGTPLPLALANIILAQERRTAKNAKRLAALEAKTAATSLEAD